MPRNMNFSQTLEAEIFDNKIFELPVLSIRQPWAWLIVNGYKDIENRTWPTQFRGKFLIHAGKKFASDFEPADERVLGERMGIILPNKFDFGGIVGIAEIIDCVTESPSPWFFGEYGFVLKNAKPLSFHPCKGKLGFFRLDK